MTDNNNDNTDNNNNNNDYLNLLIACCENLNSSDRYKLMKALKPSRFEWATLSPFDGLDGVEIYIKRCETGYVNKTEVCMRFGKSGSNYFYGLGKENETCFTEKNIRKLFFPFLKKASHGYVQIISVPGYQNDKEIVSMINKIQKQLKIKAEVKTMDFNLFN